MAEVERSWFRRRVAGEQIEFLYWTADNEDADFDGLDGVDPAAEFATFERECAAADAAGRDRALDDTFTHPRHGEMSVRWVYLHMIAEYARHNGHADLIRERIDGATGE